MLIWETEEPACPWGKPCKHKFVRYILNPWDGWWKKCRLCGGVAFFYTKGRDTPSVTPVTPQ